MTSDEGEKIQLAWLPHAIAARFHVQLEGGAAYAHYVSIGELEDGRWFVAGTTHPIRDERAYPDETAAWAAAKAWMARVPGRFEQINPYPTQDPGWSAPRWTPPGQRT